MGEPSVANAACVSSTLCTWRQAGVDRPSAIQMRLVMTLSIATDEAITPGPV
ncbi:hypothetical protein D3C72_2589160 [compost metagenome]